MARHRPQKKSATLRLNKINVAEAHIVSAVKLYFENAHPASVYLLASAAREIMTTLGIKAGGETFLHQLSAWTGQPLEQTAKKAHAFARFFKHADKDPDAVIEFPEDEADGVLFIAGREFATVTGGMPVHAQVYEAFFLAKTWPQASQLPLRKQRLAKDLFKAFYGVRSADRLKQKRIGLGVLQNALANPSLRMEIDREIKLALDVVRSSEKQ